jgi:hypothetical protein
MWLVCWWRGHKWASFDVRWWLDDPGVPQVLINDRCMRCREPRNPLIFYDQIARLAADPGANVRGGWVEY